MPSHPLKLKSPLQFKQIRDDSGTRRAAVLLLISLVLFTLSVREAGTGPLSAVRSGFQFVCSPVQVVGSFVFSPLKGLSNVFQNLTADQKSYRELLKENEELRKQNTELTESKRTSTRLQKLLDLKDVYQLKSTAARIVSGSSDSWASTVTIDKGSSSGISVGMPVSDAGGVIGQTISVGPYSATVRLINDENSSISAMLESSRSQGMLQGSADGTLYLTMVGNDQKVEVGDKVITSGLGGVFPKGLPLGIVTNVSRPTGKSYLSIVVQPPSEAENYEEVLIITSLTQDQKATAEDRVRADEQDSSLVTNRTDGSGDTSEDTSSSKKEDS